MLPVIESFEINIVHGHCCRSRLKESVFDTYTHTPTLSYIHRERRDWFSFNVVPLKLFSKLVVD
jgi:hypothetical protein